MDRLVTERDWLVTQDNCGEEYILASFRYEVDAYLFSTIVNRYSSSTDQSVVRDNRLASNE